MKLSNERLADLTGAAFAVALAAVGGSIYAEHNLDNASDPQTCQAIRPVSEECTSSETPDVSPLIGIGLLSLCGGVVLRKLILMEIAEESDAQNHERSTKPPANALPGYPESLRPDASREEKRIASELSRAFDSQMNADLLKARVDMLKNNKPDNQD
jgi:hypothetical protein